jgi:hypothetical protein
MTLYKIYGFFRLCEKCKELEPYAVGITHQSSTLRLIKYRCLRKKSTPEVIRQFPKHFELITMFSDIEWEDAYTIVQGYKLTGIAILTCSRT